MKVYSAFISTLAEDYFVRCDADNIIMRKTVDFTKFSKLGPYLTFIETGKPISREDYAFETTNNIHLLVRNIVKGEIEFKDLVYITEEKAEELKNYRIQKGDILIAISSSCGASCIYDERSDFNVTLSHYLCRIRVDDNRLNAKYLVLLLNSDFMQKYFRAVETGKSQKNLSKFYIRQAPVIAPALSEQCRLLDEIRPYALKIRELEGKIKGTQSIIDEVFAREFGFAYEEFEALKKNKLFRISLSSLDGNPDLRFSAKFHRSAGAFVVRQLTNITNKRIKDFLAEPIVLGASVSPANYSDAGDYYYISMATIKDWALNLEDANLVKNCYAETKLEKTVKKNDIILARSGEGTIGKVALIDKEGLRAVFADFTMRIRLKNYNENFAYYYFRTVYFQYLVELYKKGLGNNTNIFPSTVQEFPIPDISLEEQNRIVKEIMSEIGRQDSIRLQIGELRNKMKEMVDAVVEQFI